MQHPIEFLEHYWRHGSFRPLQEEIINAVLDNEDVFALLPTGGGKSVCFQIPALIREGICIVISPLIALMKNQVDQLKAKDIKAISIPSGIHFSELDILLDNCIHGNYKFLYLSPERLQQEIVRTRIQQMNVNLIVVDEAHCISQWGHDFRPAFRNISQLREIQPHLNIIALTATAKPKVVEDIITELDFINPKIFKASFKRPNIAFMVLETDDKYYKVEQILKRHSGPSIIYVRSRKLAHDFQVFLESRNISSTYYHGGLNSILKQSHMQLWLEEEKQVMVATTAFGMGIDKTNVKNIIHINLPESLESYYQEAGRAGRDGANAYAVILIDKTDTDKLKNQFLNVLPSIEFIKILYRKLCNYFQIPYGEGDQTTHQFNFSEFCKTYEFNSTIAYNALQILDRNSVISITQQFNYQAKLQFLVDNRTLFDFLEKNVQFELIVKSILRTYGGIFEHLLKIDLSLISSKTNISQNQLIEALQQLAHQAIVEFQFSNTDATITLLQQREDDKTINRISKIIEQQFQLRVRQVDAVIDYIGNDSICKKIQLLAYFGEKVKEECGQCSVCISRKRKKNPENERIIRNKIIQLLEGESLSSRAIVELLNDSEEQILPILKQLVEHDILKISATNTYKIAHL